MPTVVPNITSYPSVLTVTNLVRSDVRDDMPGATGTVGEGQILVNNLSVSVTMANFFNSAVRELSRQLRLVNAPMLIVDNYIIENIPPMFGPMGFQVADPAVQVAVGFNGYFDGTQWHANFRLPHGVFQVVRCWERETGSSNIFCDLGEPSNGMAGVYQTCGWGRWEWRNDMCWFPGSLDYRDLRLRYLAILDAYMVANIDLATVYVPIMDCEEALARKIDRMYAYRQGGTMLEAAIGQEQKATYDFLSEPVHRKQGANYPTNAYGNESPPVLNWGQ